MNTVPTILSDQAIVEGIRLHDNGVFKAVYQMYRPRIIQHIGNLNGTEQEAKDIFQESIIAIFINAQKPDFKLTSSFYTYLHAICHNKWLKRFREKNRHGEVSMDAVEVLNIPGETQDVLEYAERQEFLIDQLKSLGESCQELLRLSVIEMKKPEEIMLLLGFGSLQYYYKRKSNCKDKLTELSRRDSRFEDM